MSRITALVIPTVAMVALIATSFAVGAEPEMQMPGIRAEPLPLDVARTLSLSDSDAIDAARNYWEWPSKAAVTATLVSFSDDEFGPEDKTTRFYQDRPAWLVTIRGVEFHSLGGGTSVNQEVNIAVDAVSGDVLELFSYR